MLIIYMLLIGVLLCFMWSQISILKKDIISIHRGLGECLSTCDTINKEIAKLKRHLIDSQSAWESDDNWDNVTGKKDK